MKDTDFEVEVTAGTGTVVDAPLFENHTTTGANPPTKLILHVAVTIEFKSGEGYGYVTTTKQGGAKPLATWQRNEGGKVQVVTLLPPNQTLYATAVGAVSLTCKGRIVDVWV